MILAGVAVGAAIVVLIFEFLIRPQQESLYAEIIARLEAERDKALHEAKVYRNLIMPALKRAEEAESVGARPTPEQMAQVAKVVNSSRPALERRRRRVIPYLDMFNQVRKATNTSQKRTDALADAIQIAKDLAAQKQETPHAS